MTNFYVYLRRPDPYQGRPGGYILYDRTMGSERDADHRVAELKKRESVADAWHQTNTHPEAFV